MDDTSPDTSRDASPAVDPDEAAFQRLAEGLAALRRETGRLREPGAAPAPPQVDQQAIADALAEVHRRLDTVSARVTVLGNSGPILAALASVEEKIGTLTTGLDRFAEKTALTDALAQANGKIETLAARLDARLNRLQETQAALDARLRPSVLPAPAEPKPEPELEPVARRPHLPALLLILAMLIAAALALAWLRPDLVRPDWVRHEWVEPARDKLSHWLHLSAAPTGHVPGTGRAARDTGAGRARAVRGSDAG